MSYFCFDSKGDNLTAAMGGCGLWAIASATAPCPALQKPWCRAGHRSSPRLRPARPYRPDSLLNRNIFWQSLYVMQCSYHCPQMPKISKCL